MTTATTAQDHQQRAWMIVDWIMRTYTPTWLEYAGSTYDHPVSATAAALRDHTEVTDLATLDSVAEAAEIASAATTRARDATWWATKSIPEAQYYPEGCYGSVAASYDRAMDIAWGLVDAGRLWSGEAPCWDDRCKEALHTAHEAAKLGFGRLAWQEDGWERGYSVAGTRHAAVAHELARSLAGLMDRMAEVAR